MSRESLTACGIRLYRQLLRLYPAEFRRLYGEPMLQVFRDSCRSASKPLFTLWLACLFDLLVNASAEHLEIIMRRQWWLKALSLSGSIIAYFASWLGLTVAVFIISYLLLVPWEESVAPGTFAGAVSRFFESRWLVLPTLLVGICEVIAISRLSRRRVHAFSRIYWHFVLINVAVTAFAVAFAQLSVALAGHVFPTSADPRFIDPGYASVLIYAGLVILGAIIAYFTWLAWRAPTTLPTMRRKPAV